ncbi:hypothetical protein LAZ67_21000637, partial [Cordylochernes scorpioides]
MLRGGLQASCCLKRSDYCLPPTPVYFLEDSRRFYQLLSPVLLLFSFTVLQLLVNPVGSLSHDVQKSPTTWAVTFLVLFTMSMEVQLLRWSQADLFLGRFSRDALLRLVIPRRIAVRDLWYWKVGQRGEVVHGLVFILAMGEIKDLESKNKAIVESKNIHRLKLFQQKVNESEISLNQVINKLLESELDDKQYDDYSKAKEDIFNMLVSIEEALSLIETKENIHSDKQLPESNVNLPKINLPIFNGDSANWLSFREIFNSTINSNQTLTEIQKFQYLNASVKGPAEKLIRGFPISDKNYQQAWDTLCNRFNNRRELAFSQINKIFSIRPLKSISAGSLYEILDVCNEGIRNLSVLGLEKNTLTDLILINFFEKRIGEALRKEWELTLQNEEYPTFENFVNFLEKHARSLQGMRIPLFQEQKTSSKNMMAHGLYVNKGQNCILCHQIHKLNDCQRFINLPLPKKWELVKKHKLCQNCLRANHEISKCLITSRCKNCKQNHHTLLHEYNSEPSIPQPTTSQEMLISTNTICNVMPLETETNILLSTALIKVKAKDGSFVLCRALVDNGSQTCLISEQCCHKLGLEKMKNSYTLKGVGDIVVNRTTSQVEIEFTPHHNDQLFSARAFVVGRVTADLPNFQIQSADFPHLENLLLADPEFYVTKPIDLILGADTFVEIILGQKTDLKHHPIALNTKLGWLVSGRIHSTIKSNTSVINHCTTELDSSIRKFWELEDVPISKAQLGTKKAGEILFKSNLQRDIEGRYSVNLPFKSTPNLGDSRSQALEKGLQENPSKSEDNPSKSEENPSKSKKSRISKLTPQITSKQNQLLPSESSQPSTPEQPLASQSSEPLSSKKETSIIPKIKPPPYYRRKRQLPAEKTSWDEPIESDIKSNWNKFQTQLSCLKEIKIPRYLNSSSSEIEELQLHGFCDASLNAYSAVFYLKTRFKIQKIKINLITSKTKVAPLKTITIPRLELSAALLLAQLNQVILESFPFQPDKTFLWTDSQICIDWIRSDASRWKAFVSNRVSSIQNLTQITDWFHVSSQDNPADCASRGIMPQDLVNHRIWWRGPIWLQENNVRYIPSSPTQVNLNIIQEEVGEGQVLDKTTLIQNSETMLNLEFIERYSTMTKLIRITAWCWRFYYNCLLFDPIRQKGPLTTRELTKAIQVLVKSIQQVEFCTEIKLLKSNKQLPLSNKLTSLNPFFDTQGLLRVGGRLKYSYLNENQNFPLLQPKPPRQESLIKNLLTENADIPEAIDENQEDSSILETTFIIEDEESNKDIGTPKIEFSEVSVIDKSEGKYSKEPVVSVEALDKKELCHDDSAHLNVVEADLNRPKEATSGIINISTEANESASKEKAVSVEIVDTSTKDYLQSGEKAKLSRWKPIDSLCLEDVKESEDDDENYSSSAYIEWPEILKKEVLRPEALEKAVNLEDSEKAAESQQLSKEHLEESTEQGSCIKAESKTWEDPIESDLAAAESDNPAVPERELANESENLIQDSPQSDTQGWKLIKKLKNSFWSRWSKEWRIKQDNIQIVSFTEHSCHEHYSCSPADCASRGIMPQDLVNHRIWWRGPIWLQENNVRYIPSSPTQVNLNIIQEEVGEGQVLDQTTLIQNSETMLNLEFIVRYSTMTKLIRITAWCWRFYYNCLLFDPIRQKGPLTTRELTKAIQVLVKSIQQVEFCTEIKLLKSNKQLPLSIKLTSLNPFMHEPCSVDSSKCSLESCRLSAAFSKSSRLTAFSKASGLMTSFFKISGHSIYADELLNQIINTLLESELDDKQYDDYSKAKEDIFNMLVSIEEALSLIETKENIHSDKQLPESNVNLPKINLPIFNGDSANWLSFREIFNSTINSNQTLTEIQKFQYLNASVKGPAEKLIRGFPISDKNYQQAWDTLCNRFINRGELAFSQINKIFSIRPLKSISAGSLYEILDVCNEGIRNLSVLGLEKNTLTDLILINFFEKRIGEALRKEWELTLQNEEYPTFENFVNFLEKHARSLQGMRIPLFQEQKTSSKNMMAHGLYVNKGQNCILCHQIHKLNDCHRFINLPLPKKWELVKKHKLCQNCLRANHEISKCRITSRCKNCKQNHHTLLHEYNSEPSIPQPTTSQEMLISTNTICNVMPLETETNILLSTAVIKVKAKDGSFVLCRALVKNGSQICLISEQCCHKLGLEKMKNSYTLKGVGDIVVNRTTSQVEIEFTSHHNDQLFSARAFVVGRVTEDLPNFQIQSADFPHLENLLLADPEFYVTKPIDLILGADTFVEIILGQKTDLKHHPIALNTKLGWLVSGRIHSNIKSNTSVINHCTTELDSSIRKFWELEDVPISKAQLGTKNACEILFKSNLKRDIEGRYSVNLPFKSTPNLGDSRSQALRRFKNQKIKINLITSKTKVAPLKTITIPRLELSAALLLAQLNQVILESFPFQPDKTFLWTDSQICIDWIRSDASRWKAFVSNRVSSIQNLTQITDWFHVSSQDNPADCASRGIMPQDLVNHRIWWRGPIWLQENNVRYIPSSPTQVNLNIIQEEVGEGQVLDQTTLIQNSETMLNLEFIERYSTMTKLIRITAWCWRFYYNCLLFDPIRQKGPLTTRELTKAIQVLVKSIQQVEFCTEIKLLKLNKQLPLSNKLTSLNPFLDTQGLLRVGGRLKYSYLNENQKFPLLLPKNHHITNLIIDDIHRKYLHAGPQLVLSILRKNYWILGARDAVKKIIKKCLICLKFKSTTIHQIMGNLPPERIIPSRPFSKTGIDLTGPFLIKRSLGRSKTISKSYIVLFICFTTKAIHLELTTSLSTDSFMASLRRFMARRGKPSDIYSDNATNFKGASNFFRTQFQLLNSQSVQRLVTEELITWHFIPPGGPHFGGLWEAGIKSVKSHLVRTFKSTTLNYEEMNTLIIQIESCLNSRPLAPLSSDPNDYEALTPAHFLIGSSFSEIPTSNSEVLNLQTRWKLIQNLKNSFWSRWSKEYLSNLQGR